MPATDFALPQHVPLTVVTRGGIVESLHLGSVAVVDDSGQLLFGAGDPHLSTFTRRTLKPLPCCLGQIGRHGQVRRPQDCRMNLRSLQQSVTTSARCKPDLVHVAGMGRVFAGCRTRRSAG